MHSPKSARDRLTRCASTLCTGVQCAVCSLQCAVCNVHCGVQRNGQCVNCSVEEWAATRGVFTGLEGRGAAAPWLNPPPSPQGSLAVTTAYPHGAITAHVGITSC